MSGDPEQEYFADGMVEDIITALSRSKSPDTTATRPAKTPPDQTSIPNASPPATTTQTTGQTNQGPTVKEMNAKSLRAMFEAVASASRSRSADGNTSFT